MIKKMMIGMLVLEILVLFNNYADAEKSLKGEIKFKEGYPVFDIYGKEIKGKFYGFPEVMEDENKAWIKVGWFNNMLNYVKFDLPTNSIPAEKGVVSFWLKPIDWDGQDGKYHKFFEIRGDASWLLIYHHVGNNLIALMGTDIKDKSTWSSVSIKAPLWKKGEKHKLLVMWDSTTLSFFADDKLLGKAGVNSSMKGYISWIAIGPTEQWEAKGDESTLVTDVTYSGEPEEFIKQERTLKIKEASKRGVLLPVNVSSNQPGFLSSTPYNLVDEDFNSFFIPQILPAEITFEFDEEVPVSQIILFGPEGLRTISSYRWFASSDGKKFEEIVNVKDYQGKYPIVNNFPSVRAKYFKLLIEDGQSAILPSLSEIRFNPQQEQVAIQPPEPVSPLTLNVLVEKLTYKLGENVKIVVEIKNNAEDSLKGRIRLVHQAGVGKKQILMDEDVFLEKGGCFVKKLNLKAKELFGHLLRASFQNKDRNLLSEGYFEVLSKRTKGIRMATHTHYGYDLIRPNIKEEKLRGIVEEYKNNCINAIILYSWSPDHGVLIPPESDVWTNPIYKHQMIFSGSSIKLLKKICEEKGIALIGYDEPCSKEFCVYGPLEIPSDSKKRFSIPFYGLNKRFKLGEVVNIYGSSYGPDLNILTGKNYYAEQMGKSKEIFQWDGFWIDSLVWLAEITAFGRNKSGEKITNLFPDDLLYDFLKAIRSKVGNDFVLMANMGLHDGYPFPPLTKEDATYAKSATLLDGWTVEFPPKPTLLNQGIYPQTWIELARTYQNLKNAYPQTNFNVVYNTDAIWHLSIDQFKALRAITHACGFGIYHSGGPGEISKTVDYSKFVLRYGELLYSDGLENTGTVQSSLSFVRELSNLFSYYDKEKRRFIIHLINVPPEDNIWKARTQDILPVSNINFTFKHPLITPDRISEAYFVSADDGENDIHPLKFEIKNNSINLTLSEMKIWSIVVVQLK